MKSLRRTLIATSFTTSLALAFLAPVYAEAPVVDESENFALFEQQAAPAVRGERYARLDEDRPLAHEDYQDSQSTSSNTALINKIQGLQQDIQELRGQLEVQAHDLKALQQQQVEFYKDLDARLRHEPIAQPAPSKTMSSNTAASTPYDLDEPSAAPAPKAQPIPTNTKDEKTSYLSAYELISHKQYAEALPAMETFVQQYPQGGYTANAHYWIGELYMVQKDYPKAIEHFDRVLQNFPSSNKSSASMLKIGYALAAAGEINAAKQRLQTVVKQYPDTHAAQLALAKLESLGHQ